MPDRTRFVLVSNYTGWPQKTVEYSGFSIIRIYTFFILTHSDRGVYFTSKSLNSHTPLETLENKVC